MKNLKWVIVIIFVAIFGYILGNILPFKFSSFTGGSEKGIRGDAQLTITAKMEDTSNVVPNLEIDLAPQPGQPPTGGVAITNESGVAKFNVKPGKYYLYFNQNTFPKNLKMPEPEQITVNEEVNEKIILLYLKR